MAGYLFGLDSVESLENCISNGVYATRMGVPNRIWGIPHEGTFADYSSMKEGDNVYFFIKRKIYGIGKLVNINNDCKYLNYPNANIPETADYADIQRSLLIDEGAESVNERFICVFEPAPFFFRNGIDMDDVLSSDPVKFKMLRAFWKLSFIKFADEENQGFKNIILRRNLEVLLANDGANIFASGHMAIHRQIQEKLALQDHALDIAPFLNTINNGTAIRHEMAVEAALIFQLATGHRNTIEVFGEWDYLSHQVVASPFKPIDYIDKMDVFGYKYIPGQSPTIGKYLLVELKKEMVSEQDLLQLMKYVDWIKNEYASGEYSMINAFLVGYTISDACIARLQELVERNYIHGVRPSISKRWRNVKLATYRFDEAQNRLVFEVVADANV